MKSKIRNFFFVTVLPAVLWGNTVISFMWGPNFLRLIMNCQDFNNLIKLSDFLHFNEIWLMFPQFPMYETNAIQLQFLVQLFWYLSQWSGLTCFIFCTRLYSKDIHCALVLTLLSKTSCFVKTGGRFFQSFWPSHNV